MAKAPKTPLSVGALKHDDATRKNIPTAEYQSVMQKNEQTPVRIAYERRNRDLDPQLVWRGKVQCIYFDPPYGIKFNSNFQWSTSSRDVKDGNTSEVRSDGAEGIACWFMDTDYNMESFFVRHAYFLGANAPYKTLKTTLKAEINEEAWATPNNDTSRPFDKPKSGRIAVKVINHLGDEVMKVFKVN
jgi:hypothetical protein